jgi:hypothetical protein
VGEHLGERRDPLPVGVLRGERTGVAGGDRGLQGVGTEHATECFGPFERLEAAADEQPVPKPAVLVGEQDGRSGRAGPGAGA